MTRVLLFIVSLFLSCSKNGEFLPEFKLYTLDGISISNHELNGKIVVIYVWATWCHNCISELEDLNNLSKKYKNDTSIVFLALSDESSEIINRFLNKRAFTYLQIPMANSLSDQLQTRLVKTFPQHVIANKIGKITFIHTGEIPNSLELISQEIEKIH